ncbi:MAG: DUF4062 domain-containing protein, partial [Planctomycetes bacterium]|nr:DUF4062 domain-containing protein [Planctomycetota bacterium]
MALETVKVFISSPGDVGPERLLTTRVLDRLRGEFAGRLHIEAVLWEHEPLRATDHFQRQLVKPSDCDIVVCILWWRLGTRLPDDFCRADGSTFSSGTEWEFEDAAESFRRCGAPDLVVYRKLGNPEMALSTKQEMLERFEQKEALDAFIDRWFGNPQTGFKAAFHPFQTADEFERLVETHLRNLLNQRAVRAVPVAHADEPPPVWHRGSPFRGLQAFDFEHAQVFFGRTQAVADVQQALVRQTAAGRAFVLVLGASGSG